MPRTIRFHLDENCDPRIAAGLKLHGVDVTIPAEIGLLQSPDEGHLAHAIAQGRVIVTQDTDFLRMAAAGKENPGIAFYPNQGRSIGQVIRALLLIWEVYEPEEMRNRVEFI
jgi:predicted nuclease of predicted toxin-antitoxin system